MNLFVRITGVVGSSEGEAATHLDIADGISTLCPLVAIHWMKAMLI